MTSTLLARILTQLSKDPELEAHRGKLYKLRNLAQSLGYELKRLERDAERGEEEEDDKFQDLRDTYNRARKGASLEAAYIDRIEMELLQRSNFKNDADWDKLQEKLQLRKVDITRMEEALGVKKQKEDEPTMLRDRTDSYASSLVRGPSRYETVARNRQMRTTGF